MKEAPSGRDCLEVAEARLLSENWMDEALLAEWREAAARAVVEAVAQVQREPGPDPYSEDWCALATPALSEGRSE